MNRHTFAVCRQSGIRTDFHMGYGGFFFIFFRDSVTENVTERKLPSHQIVLNLLKENPMRSREEMAGIRRIGTARAGYWEVVQDRREAAGGRHAGMEDE